MVQGWWGDEGETFSSYQCLGPTPKDLCSVGLG